MCRVNSHDEKVAMNEVFAHAALIKHKHVVRYYNSWVEKGQVRAALHSTFRSSVSTPRQNQVSLAA
jgi:hypothetical protein